MKYNSSVYKWGIWRGFWGVLPLLNLWRKDTFSLSLSCARSRALYVYTTIPLNLLAYDKRVQLNIRKTYKSWLVELKISALFNHSLYPSKRMSIHS